ncbi:MAG: hypothetical protein BMS9Abin05_1810 [Rhodothermia bacterium]|nr:MAG: hypothetical protein BMS9Abin05_1810 [Rhodothermia bacterium]
MNSRMNSNETELVKAAQGGDALAFEELIRRHDRRLLQVAHGIMGNMQDAYDAYQDSIIRGYTKLDSFRFESSFGTWLTRIVMYALTSCWGSPGERPGWRYCSSQKHWERYRR